MTYTQQNLALYGLVFASAWSFQGCTKDAKCQASYQPGPAIVTIDCTDEARADALPNDVLVVEYTDEYGNWKPCRRNDLHTLEVPATPYTQPVCDAAKPTTPRFDCGHSVGTFEIRATQGARTAGPIEIKTRMKNACAYDDKTLYHELTLDLP